MSVSRVKTWAAGETLTAADLNAEFNNILNNADNLASPRGAALDMNGQQLVLDADADSYLVEETDDVLLLRLQGVNLFRWDGDVTSPVNGLTFTASATTVATSINAVGSDTDIGINLVPKGAGTVQIGGSAVQGQGDVLDDLNTLGANSADSEFLVGTGAGALAWESGATARTSLGVAIGTDVQAYDADTLKADTADTLTAGFNATVYDAGTKASGTFTPDPANGNYQKCVNGGAFTLGLVASSTTIVLQVTNNASAGAVTTSAYTLVDGDTISTTDGDDFMFYITVCGSFSHLHVTALQ